MAIFDFRKCLPLLFFILPFDAFASVYDYFPKKLGYSSTNYGVTGLIQLPSARFMDEGSMKIGYSSSFPYEYTFIENSTGSFNSSTLYLGFNISRAFTLGSNKKEEW